MSTARWSLSSSSNLSVKSSRTQLKDRIPLHNMLVNLPILLSVITPLVLAQSSPADCPNGSSYNNIDGHKFCCPANVYQERDDIYCLIGCQIGFPDCFPNCSGGITANDQTTSGTCTSIPVTASDYSSRVFGMAGSATTSGAAATDSASATTGSGSSSTAGSGTAAQTVTVTTGASTTGPSSTSSGNAAPAITAGPMMALGVLAGAILL